MSRFDSQAAQRAAQPIPAGRIPSPPRQPPSVSPSTLKGQEETNNPAPPEGSEIVKDDMYATAFEFGWQSYLQHGRDAVSKPPTFESIEPELAQRWQARKNDRLPWQAAREVAKDAWNRVQEAMTEGTQAKSSAR